MKEVLLIGCALLIVLLLLQMQFHSQYFESNIKDWTGTDVTILSAGKTFDKAQKGRRKCTGAFFIGGSIFEHNRMKDGLWVCVVTEDQKILTPKSFDIQHSPDDIASFLEMVLYSADNVVVLMAANRSIQLPKDPKLNQAIPLLLNAFKTLELHTEPYNYCAASWAFAAWRNKGKWIPLAEGFSDYRPIRLNLWLPRQFKDLKNSEPLLLTYRQKPSRRNFHLMDYLEKASLLAPKPIYEPQLHLRDDIVDGVFQTTSEESTGSEKAMNRIVWENIMLGTTPEFFSMLDATPWNGSAKEGVFEIHVNRKQVSTKLVNVQKTGERMWRPWRVNLASFSGQTIDLELRVTAPDQKPVPITYWGDPYLSYSP